MDELVRTHTIKITKLDKAGIHGESRMNLLKRLKYKEQPFDGTVLYKIATHDDVVVLANGHDIGVLADTSIPLIRQKAPILSVVSDPVISELFGEDDRIIYAAEVEIEEAYESEEQLKKIQIAEKRFAQGEKMRAAGESMQKAGTKIENTGKAITSFVATLFLLLIIFFLWRGCMG